VRLIRAATAPSPRIALAHARSGSSLAAIDSHLNAFGCDWVGAEDQIQPQSPATMKGPGSIVPLGVETVVSRLYAEQIDHPPLEHGLEPVTFWLGEVDRLAPPCGVVDVTLVRGDVEVAGNDELVSRVECVADPGLE